MSSHLLYIENSRACDVAWFVTHLRWTWCSLTLLENMWKVVSSGTETTDADVTHRWCSQQSAVVCKCHTVFHTVSAFIALYPPMTLLLPLSRTSNQIFFYFIYDLLASGAAGLFPCPPPDALHVRFLPLVSLGCKHEGELVCVWLCSLFVDCSLSVRWRKVVILTAAVSYFQHHY